MGVICTENNRQNLKEKINKNNSNKNLNQDNNNKDNINKSSNINSKNIENNNSLNNINNNNGSNGHVENNKKNINNFDSCKNISIIKKKFDESSSQSNQQFISSSGNNTEELLKNQFIGEISTKKSIKPLKKSNKEMVYFNFKEKIIPLKEGEKPGCGYKSINTFCLFKSIQRETYLVYSIKNSKKGYVKIYALDLDENKKKILEEFYDKNQNDNIVNRNRHIPTQIRYFIIGVNEYIIAGFRDSSIYVWELIDSEFEIKLRIFNKDEKEGIINAVSLFNDIKSNKLKIIFSMYQQSIIKISDFQENISTLNIDENIYFLDTFEKDNENYIISGLLNEVVVFKFNEINQNYIHFKNNQTVVQHTKGKGHECVVICKSRENEFETKLIDSDTQGKCINIFNFNTAELLLILNLKICSPLGINIWNKNNIIVSCLEDKENNTIKIIKVNLTKKYYNQKVVDLEENEDGNEGKIIYSLKGHDDGTLSCLKMLNEEYGEFFVSIGNDNCLKLWINDLSESSMDFSL